MKLDRVSRPIHAAVPASHAKYLRLVVSPVEEDAREPSSATGDTRGTRVDEDEVDALYASHDGYPVFKHRHEASTAELFYDLFFVANLTTFTFDHEISDARTLASYMGFFGLMWSTWLQTTLFDVRFAVDSIFTRLCKLLSLGVMGGFAVVGSQYDTGYVFDKLGAFRALSIVLMVSRLILVVQYASVLWFVRAYREASMVLLLTMATLTITAFAYFGMFFAFHGTANAHAYVGWYVIATVEALAITGITCFWKRLSFRRTYLVERVGLLTLIIMGEGIIGMSRSIARIFQNSSSVSANDIGVITSGIVLVYFVYLLYFGQFEQDRFGTVRQHLWTLLHFPLHVAILLTGEGNTQFILWAAILNEFHAVEILLTPFLTFVTPGGTVDFDSTETYVSGLNASLALIRKRYKENTLPTYSTLLNEIGQYNISLPADQNQVGQIVTELLVKIWIFVLDNFQVEVENSSHGTSNNTTSHAATPASDSDTSDDLSTFLHAFSVFEVVLQFFFVAAGALLILLGLMLWFGKRHQNRQEVLSIVIRFVLGVGLVLVILTGYNKTVFGNLLVSTWLIPIVVLVYTIAILLDHILRRCEARVQAKATSPSI